MPGEWRTPISLAYVWDSRCRNSTPPEQRASLRESSVGRAGHGTLGVPTQRGPHDGDFETFGTSVPQRRLLARTQSLADDSFRTLSGLTGSPRLAAVQK